MNLRNLYARLEGDKVIWAVVLLMAIISVLTVYSSIVSLAYKYRSGNTEYFLFKHSIILLIGFILMYTAHKIKFTYYSKISQLAVWIAVPLLGLTLFSGTNINEASRWLVIPVINQTFQTSDLAKLAIIMYIARLLSKKQDSIKSFNESFVPIMVPVLIVCGLILPANFSTASILFVVCIMLMFIGRVNLKYIFAFFGVGLVALATFVAIKFNSVSTGRLGTWQNRIEHFMDGDADGNYQVRQSKIAIATGEIIGKGPGRSVQRNFLPHPYSDFIYAIIIEEYGLVGGFGILMLYLVLLYRGVKIASDCPRTFGSLLAIGLCLSLVFQAMINMAVAVNLFPVTGQPLPMISMGGTSIWFTCITIGIILSVSRENEQNARKNIPVEIHH